MRAAVVTEFGDATVIRTQEWPDPEPAAGQVVVEVELADIMWVDTAIRRGMHGSFFAVEPPYVPGALFGGRVSAAGPDVPAEWVGKTVVGRSAAFGAHAELVVADIGAVTELPPGVDLAAAVAASGDGMTALMLEELAPAMQGKDVLITAAAGAMGLLLIQLAHRAGARVVAAARGEAKLELSKTQGPTSWSTTASRAGRRPCWQLLATVVWTSSLTAPAVRSAQPRSVWSRTADGSPRMAHLAAASHRSTQLRRSVAASPSRASWICVLTVRRRLSPART